MHDKKKPVVSWIHDTNFMIHEYLFAITCSVAGFRVEGQHFDTFVVGAGGQQLSTWTPGYTIYRAFVMLVPLEADYRRFTCARTTKKETTKQQCVNWKILILWINRAVHPKLWHHLLALMLLQNCTTDLFKLSSLCSKEETNSYRLRISK